MSKAIDKFINLFKWPMAWYMLILLPALISSVNFFQFTNLKNLALLCGLVFFVFSKTMMDASVRTSMQVIAHEFTHTFFALLTFHKIKHIRLNPDDTGGEMGFIGDGNWLIVIAPYFFPLFCLIYMVIMNFLPNSLIYNAVLGFFLGYHIDTVASQIHPEQTDLPKVGYRFCLMFLPGVNLLTIGSIIAFNISGINGVLKYFHFINELTGKYFNEIKMLLSSLF
ncbi:MAG: M50 family metallopeptidase [Alphaproteobacteria bacterium]|nr:M50 family metallopeptidase [Alphaproteobacteria bacterium]